MPKCPISDGQPVSVYLKSSPRHRPQSSTGPGRISDRHRLNEAAGPTEAVLWRFNRPQALRAMPSRVSTAPREPLVGLKRAVQRRLRRRPGLRNRDFMSRIIPQEVRLDTPPGSTVEQINIGIGPWVDESLGWSLGARAQGACRGERDHPTFLNPGQGDV